MFRSEEHDDPRVSILLLFVVLVFCTPVCAQDAEPAPANLQFDGKDQGQLAIVTTYSDFRHPVSLQPTNATPATSIVVSLSPLRGAKQPEIAINFDEGAGTSRTFESLSEATHLILRARLPESGSYRGWMYLSYNNGVEPVRSQFELVITKSIAPSTLTAETKPAGQWSLQRLSRDVTVEIDFVETGGRAIELGRIRLATLKIAPDGGAERAAKTGNASFEITSEDLGDQPSTRVEPNGGVTLKATIPGVQEAGRYEGKIVLEAQDQQPANADFTFLVRANWLVAAAFIGLGILVSLILRIWRESWQPRLVAANKAVRAVTAINRFRNKVEPLDNIEKSVIDDIRSHLTEYIGALRSGIGPIDDALVDVSLEKQTLYIKWLELRRLITSLSDLPNDQKQKLEDTRQLLVDSKTTKVQLTNAVNLIPEIRQAVLTLVKNEITFQRELLEGFEDELPDKTLFDRWDTAVKNVLEEAESAAERGDLATAQGVVDSARRSAAQILAASMASKKVDGLAFNSAERALFDRHLKVAQESDVSGYAIESYENALRLYLIGLGRALRALLHDAAAVVTAEIQNTQQNATVLQQALTKISTALVGLTGVRDQIRSGDFDAARSACADAMDALEPPTGLKVDYPSNPFVDKSKATAAQSATATATPSVGSLVDIALPLPIGVIDPEAPEAATSAIGQWLTIGNVLYNVAVVLIAILVGLYVLWASKATWGSNTDVMLAVLWGLGLHSLATSAGTYQGLSNLGTTIR